VTNMHGIKGAKEETYLQGCGFFKVHPGRLTTFEVII
jgi:hypothetical protein